MDSLVSVMQIINQIYLIGGRIPGRTGNAYESTAPYDTFPTKDGQHVVIGVANDKFWRQICEMMGRTELIHHPDMAKNGDRVRNRDKIKPIVTEWTMTKTAKELVDQLLEAGLPTAPIYDVKQVTEDPHIAGAREMTETKPGFKSPAPALGQHNREIYGGMLGFTEEQLNKMKEDGVI